MEVSGCAPEGGGGGRGGGAQAQARPGPARVGRHGGTPEGRGGGRGRGRGGARAGARSEGGPATWGPQPWRGVGEGECLGPGAERGGAGGGRGPRAARGAPPQRRPRAARHGGCARVRGAPALAAGHATPTRPPLVPWSPGSFILSPPPALPAKRFWLWQKHLFGKNTKLDGNIPVKYLKLHQIKF